MKNTYESKFMISKTPKERRLYIRGKKEILVAGYNYLGNTVSSNGKLDEEIMNKMHTTASTIRKGNEVQDICNSYSTDSDIWCC